MKKKLLAIFLSFGMVLCFAACGNQQPVPDVEDDSEPVSGGWTVNEDLAELELSGSEADNFAAALESYEENVGDVADLKPVSLMATMKDSGTSYVYLCKSEDGLSTLSFTTDENDKVGCVAVSDFDIADYTEDNDPIIDDGEISWEINEDQPADISEEMQAIFDKATADFTGSDIKPIALLGTQVVAGTNYAFLCVGKTVTAEPVTNMQVVTIYVDPDGNAEINSICNLDMTRY